MFTTRITQSLLFTTLVQKEKEILHDSLLAENELHVI